MYKLIHFIYELIGHIFAFFSGMWFTLRDIFNPPQEKTVLFIAHPEDDMLFFHSFIIKNKPYVVLLTTAGIIRRYLPFCRAMRYYRVRYRAYDMSSRATENEEIISRRIHSVLIRGRFEICATHNAEGEYGHLMHQCIHKCVRRLWKGKKLLVPCDKQHIVEYRLSRSQEIEKRMLLQTYYAGEYTTLQKFDTWITHEHLDSIDNMNAV